ncbi:single-stranded DNA-binding protein [Streptomyces lydicus]|uniref:single-stranded DNA-binding protein n=1 Tax=Streptomyces lydicus TaxID=47763 RepID=UPI0005255654|nr:single-stranded DNA-binding protein [Streptomyces lydicus]MDC7338941.1 single-stranded DNA-binding protein [Streptomyces lydicus]UEG91564.1 single-stranded DNA-binding protein [Streptomyces lydicus]
MSVGETPITIVGNLAADPELRFTPSGAAMVKFSVASTPRSYDKTSGQWQDGTAMFLRCTAWRDLANHVADTLAKGTRVVVTGRLRQHNWQTPEGENRSMLALEVDDIGPSLRFATAKVERVQRANPAPASTWDQWTSSGQAAPGAAPEEPPF